MAEFQRDRFARLLQQAIGPDTQKHFAQTCQISSEHLNRLLHQKTPHPPSKVFLSRLAANSHAAITLEELYDACGYESNIPEKISNRLLAYFQKFADFQWSVIKEPSCSLTLRFQQGAVDAYHFYYLPEISECHYAQLITDTYLPFIYEEPKTTEIKCLVTTNAQLYHYCEQQIPCGLNHTIKLVLLDLKTGKILSEILLCRELHFPENRLAQYQLALF